VPATEVPCQDVALCPQLAACARLRRSKESSLHNVYTIPEAVASKFPSDLDLAGSLVFHKCGKPVHEQLWMRGRKP
jgi:hypothetical protein